MKGWMATTGGRNTPAGRLCVNAALSLVVDWAISDKRAAFINDAIVGQPFQFDGLTI